MLQVAKKVRNLKHAVCILQQSKLANLPGYATRVVHWHLLDGPPLLTFGRSNDIYHSETTRRLRKLDAASWGPEKSYICIIYPYYVSCILHCMLLRPCRVEDHDVPNWQVGFFTCATWMAQAAHPSMHNPNHPGAQLLSCQHILHWVSPLWWPGNEMWNHEM